MYPRFRFVGKMFGAVAEGLRESAGPFIRTDGLQPATEGAEGRGTHVAGDTNFMRSFRFIYFFIPKENTANKPSTSTCTQ